MKRYYIYLLICIGLIIGSWFYTVKIKPNFYILTIPPAEHKLKLMSLGDESFLHKIYALNLQNAGDSCGRFTPLQDYNYDDLYKWLILLDTLDNKSNILPAAVSYYFSQTQRPEDNKYLVEYLVKHSEQNPEDKWWWLYQAVHIANYRLKDKRLALDVSYKLASVDLDLPSWAKQMPAFLHEQLGEFDMANKVILDLLKSDYPYSKEELDFMNYFIIERINKYMPNQ